MVRRALLAVLALGVMLGLAGMHEVISGPNAADSAVSVHMQHVIAQDHSALSRPTMQAAVTILSPPGGDMAHAMETCCMALVVMLALAVLATPGVLGTLTGLRPRGQLAPSTSPRSMRGIERNLALGALRI